MFFENEQSQSLMTKANEFADSCNAGFIMTGTNFEQQCMCSYRQTYALFYSNSYGYRVSLLNNCSQRNNAVL